MYNKEKIGLWFLQHGSGVSLKERVQGDTFITRSTVSYKLFISQNKNTPLTFPAAWILSLTTSYFPPPFSSFPFTVVVVIFLLSVQLQLSAEAVGEVYIKSTQSGQYLAMDPNGMLYGSVSRRCVWHQTRSGPEVCGTLVALSNANRQQQLASVCYSGSWTATLHPALFWGEINNQITPFTALPLNKHCVSYLEQQLLCIPLAAASMAGGGDPGRVQGWGTYSLALPAPAVLCPHLCLPPAAL